MAMAGEVTPEGGARPDAGAAARAQAVNRADMLIVGAGFSGLIMAMEARRRGVRDVAVLEKADEIGGTWRENTYPGVACDIPSHLYSIEDRPKADWTRVYPPGAEIQAYLKEVCEAEGLGELIRFGRTLRRAEWDAGARRWRVETQEGERWEARILVSAIGALHVPKAPEIEGLESFAGEQWHSARWRHDVDLTGKRVAVIGTGASAIQFVPEVAKAAGRATVFQRSAPYVVPRPDGPISPRMRRLYAALPPLRAARRRADFWLHEIRHATFTGKPRAVAFAMRMWRRHLEGAIADPELRRRLTPDYRIGCKRILLSNDFYPAMTRENVALVTEPIARVAPEGVVTRDGTLHAADVLIYGTGFHVTDALGALDIRGAGGRPLAEAWAQGMSAHLGMSVAGFPNLFFLLGPHTGLGHNSVVLMIEAQARHLGRLIDGMRGAGLSAVEPKPERQRAFSGEVTERLAGMVWQAGGCASWYQDAQGRNTTLWPGTVREYQRRMAGAGLDEYREAEG